MLACQQWCVLEAVTVPCTRNNFMHLTFFFRKPCNEFEEMAAGDPWVPLPRQDSSFSIQGSLEDMMAMPLPRPKSLASIVDNDDGEFVRVNLMNVQVNTHSQESAETAKFQRRGVHFEERKKAKLERRADILWHLIPEPTPPKDRKKFARRRSEDVVFVASIGSEDSTVSSAGRISQPNQVKKKKNQVNRV